MTEQQYNKLYLMRRLGVIDELIDNSMESVYTKASSYYDICDYGSDTFIDVVSEWVVERMYYDYFGNMDDSSEEWGEVYHKIKDYIDKKHADKIVSLYNKVCNKK